MALYQVSISGNLIVGTNQTPIIKITQSETIQKVYADLKDDPTGQSVLFDINKNGSTIWSTQANRLAVGAGAVAGSQTAFNTTDLVEGDVLTVDVDQIGSGDPGEDATITIKTI
jgi:hypothetical protein